MPSLIPADQHFAVFAALLLLAMFGFWAEKQKWGKILPGAAWTILVAIFAANLKLIPHSAAAYDIVFSYFVPILLPLFLIQANVKRIIAESGRVGMAFILASLGTMLGALTATQLVDLGEHSDVLTGMFIGTYIGGSANFAAIAQSSQFQDSNAIAAATAADNLLGILFLIIITAMPSSRWLMSKYAQRNHHAPAQADTEIGESKVTGASLAASLSFALVVVVLADFLVFGLNQLTESNSFNYLRYLFITLFSVIPATLIPSKMQQLHGGQSLGIMLAFIFFAAITAGADIEKMLSYAPIMMLFVTILLATHWLVVFVGGYLFSQFCLKQGKPDLCLSLPELVIASNAAILGATTAPAHAMSKGWGTLVTPGVLAGVAGYMIGTPLGLLILS